MGPLWMTENQVEVLKRCPEFAGVREGEDYRIYPKPGSPEYEKAVAELEKAFLDNKHQERT